MLWASWVAVHDHIIVSIHTLRLNHKIPGNFPCDSACIQAKEFVAPVLVGCACRSVRCEFLSFRIFEHLSRCGQLELRELGWVERGKATWERHWTTYNKTCIIAHPVPNFGTERKTVGVVWACSRSAGFTVPASKAYTYGQTIKYVWTCQRFLHSGRHLSKLPKNAAKKVRVDARKYTRAQNRRSQTHGLVPCEYRNTGNN